MNGWKSKSAQDSKTDLLAGRLPARLNPEENVRVQISKV
jgi:hypothetical protein